MYDPTSSLEERVALLEVRIEKLRELSQQTVLTVVRTISQLEESIQTHHTTLNTIIDAANKTNLSLRGLIAVLKVTLPQDLVIQAADLPPQLIDDLLDAGIEP